MRKRPVSARTLVFAACFWLGGTAAIASEQQCPDFHGDYCCGISAGDVQRCVDPMHVEQKQIEGGEAYTFSKPDGQVTSIVADGKVRPLDRSPYTGDATTTCSGNAVIVSAPVAGIDVLPGAKGHYRGFTHIDSSGWMTSGEDCGFSDHGVPVATTCGLGTGFGCRRKH